MLNQFLSNLQSQVQKNPPNPQAIEVVAALYYSWRARNGRVHNKYFSLQEPLLHLFTLMRPKSNFHPTWGTGIPPALTVWQPLCSHLDPRPPRWIKVNFAGSIKQNGMASTGGVVQDHQGNFLIAVGSKLYTHATSSAEAMGALAVMTAAREWADIANEIWIEGNSAITIEDLHRTARGHPPDKTMARIADLFCAFKPYRISHIYRAANKVTDFVASFSCFDDIEWHRGMSLPLTFV
ncbi:hypothetical protein AXF42_Ash005404 [Apostasia shenzhenica]|uniref:RNase H type-1 domain-containing protein n=1 Tax=Apostasia shenzhenica TaxID=1088818 RepID=A0A2I0B6T9_9ASPA|nr:hypothetical protein AXF42_Ash005404 [Apostasia shenzhenica]